MTAEVKIDIDDVRTAGSVAKAIEAWAAKSDRVASGVVGPTFATSGPGAGWQREYDCNDFAEEALSDGAAAYIDSHDGRMLKGRAPTADDDPDDIETDIGGGEYVVGEWSDESVVRVACPSVDDAIAYPDAAAAMARAVRDYHAAESDVAAWRRLLNDVRQSSAALDDIELPE